MSHTHCIVTDHGTERISEAAFEVLAREERIAVAAAEKRLRRLHRIEIISAVVIYTVFGFIAGYTWPR